MEPPDVELWQTLIRATEKYDPRELEEKFRPRNSTYLQDLADDFSSEFVHPYCQEYRRKFHNDDWDPRNWRDRVRSNHPDDPVVREAIKAVLETIVATPYFYGPFFQYVPTFYADQKGSRRYSGNAFHPRTALPVRLPELVPFDMPHDGAKYRVSADMSLMSVYLDPYTDDPKAWALAERLVVYRGLAGYL